MSKQLGSQGNTPGWRVSQPPGQTLIYALLTFNGATPYKTEQFTDEQCVIYIDHRVLLCFRVGHCRYG